MGQQGEQGAEVAGRELSRVKSAEVEELVGRTENILKVKEV
jgi:hypothetical protein